MSALIHVDFSYLPVINFAMQQNRVAVIRQLSLQNNSDAELHNLKVTLQTKPDFGIAQPVMVESLPVGTSIRVETLQLNLSVDFFTQLTERLAGEFILTVEQGEAILFTQKYPVDILAFDQWSGTAVLPEMLSAFVTPNHPFIAPILKRAAAILEQWTGNPSFDEYQSRNPDRVQKQMAAIYNAIAEQGIIYSTVPAGFEKSGQRVRMIETIMSQMLGTCLDMALLYASCLEAVGIHPLVVLISGHAFAGGWLIPDTFPDPVIDDVSLLTKRNAEGINEITLVETTGMNMGQHVDFDQAVSRIKLNPSDFVLALDVKRARFSGIRPLPQRVLKGYEWEIQQEENAEKATMEAPVAVNPYDLSGINNEITITRQLLWERKLLDLSLRNNLLNIRVTKNTLQFISADLHLLEDALADGAEFSIMPKPTDWDNPLYEFGVYHTIQKTDPVAQLVNSELTQHRLRSYLPENELSKALTHLYRSSRTAMEENGANTLYIALGLLKWYETPASERPRYAPVLLLPVEIVRKSAAKGYVIRTREEETMMNITLLEMLRQNFAINISGLETLPSDGSGVNVKLIYSIIRNAIKNQAKWDVEEEAMLGIFSFNKFIMWNDIHNNAHKLIENKFVSSLMNGKIEWEIKEEAADATVLNKELSPTDIVLPINADSSQLEAIFETTTGNSFILHGPPGTGKSQTITNIIANALYRGKRVLFVAEKMAALSVVQYRLSTIGLAPFCLELHSNKAKKTAVLNQLKQTTEIVRKHPPEDYAREAERVHAVREEINTYIESLHKKYPFGLSLYDAITRYLSFEGVDEIAVPSQLPYSMTGDSFIIWNEAIETLISTVNACGHPHAHPLTGINIDTYSAQKREEAAQLINQSTLLLKEMQGKLPAFLKVFIDSPEQQPAKKHIDILFTISKLLLKIPELTATLLQQPDLNGVLEEAEQTLAHGRLRDELKQQVTAAFSAAVLGINAQQLLHEWNEGCTKWFFPKYLATRRIKKKLKTYALNNRIEHEEVVPLLTRLIHYRENVQYLEQHAVQFPAFFGRSGRKESENWNTIAEIISGAREIDKLIYLSANDISEATTLRNKLCIQLTHGISPFKGMYAEMLKDITELSDKLNDADRQLTTVLGVDDNELYNGTDNWVNNGMARLQTWSASLHMLKDWYQWLTVYRKFEELNIVFVADAFKNENINTDKIQDVFSKSLYKTVAQYILGKEPGLELFKGEIFNDVIHKYKKLSSDFEALTRHELYARLASNLPSFTREATQSSEVGILQRNIRNNARGTSIRKLFDQIPTLLSRMCPCMLMSPISVAQYIDPDAEKFDLVIFDEASQMPTSEAVGAIARGANVVIVGDPKQMPPTSFFNTTNYDEDNADMEDLESILDDCLALSMPSKYLLWHYRSKHESLIAFSNAEYYDNKLLTFPSPDNIESKVKLVQVSGQYDKGRSRQNKVEAQAVIDEIARRLRDPELRKKSIGVVTFSAVQQTLIEDMLSDMFIFNPMLETLALECEEPLFIKNLENVQGDERDVILFSVGYGPDAGGNVSMNFGPLNRQGGERRLNVAVSRARYEMIIFSTLRSEQIDLNRTSAVGVAGLKRFLEYAEKGTRHTIPHEQTTASGIKQLIAAALQRNGFEAHTNVGCSGYKVDVAVIDKNDTSRYILGILCDGENYRKTKTIRDREIVQQNVLELLGWNICRVWTMDWWENPDKTLNKLLTTISQVESGQSLPKIQSVDEEKIIAAEKVQPVIVKNKQKDAPYVKAVLKYVTYSPAFFYSPKYVSVISKQIEKVIEAEAPVSRSLICKRIQTAWNIPRMTTKLDTYLDSLFDECGYYSSKYNDDLTFFWKNEEQFNNYDEYRPDSDREAADLPPQEVAVAIKQFLTEEISLPVTDLVKHTAQMFGFARIGANIEAAVQRGIVIAKARGFVKEENGRVKIES